MKFTAAMEEAGFRSAALYDPSVFPVLPQIEINPTHQIWRRLITQYRVPFLKIELLRDNPLRIANLRYWPAVFADASPALLQYAKELDGRRLDGRASLNLDQFKADLDDLFASQGRSRAQKLTLGTLGVVRSFHHFGRKSLKDAVRLPRRLVKKIARIRPRHFHPLHIMNKVGKIASSAKKRLS